jgi:serine protease Do
MSRRPAFSSSARHHGGNPVHSVALIASALSILLLFPTLAETESVETFSEKVKEIFQLHKSAIVQVESADQHGKLYGTGFYAGPDGTIYTVASLVGDGKSITVYQGSTKLPARLLQVDPRSGIALLKVEATTPFLPLGDSSKLEVATPLMSIGYPMDLSPSPSFGLVAGIERKFFDRYLRTTHVRANIPIQRGFGGAPVLNLHGEVVGIVVSGLNGEPGCYFLPINAAEKLRADYSRFNELRPGWVGVIVKDDPLTKAPSTARLEEVLPGGPADLEGLRNGDILLKVGDFPIVSPEDLIDASFFLTAGDQTPITVLRDGNEITVQVRSVQHPGMRAGMRDPGLETPSLKNDLQTALELTASKSLMFRLQEN